jgi:lysine 2,3-aminomutase
MIRDIDSVISAGWAAEADRAGLEAVGERYAIAIPPTLAALIGDPGDPIGLQFVPHPDERLLAPHESPDPIGDDALSPLPGIVHRYADRVLLKPLLICPVYCRFCFRREHVGPDGGLLTEAQLTAAYAWITARPAIREVILTGGDPLMLSPRRLGAIMAALSTIPHVETIRLHSRLPVAQPERLTEAMADAMESGGGVWLVVHANHAREFSPAAQAALRRVQRRGIPVLGQSVLLRGVNDTVDALEGLLRAMVAARVKPYYLHQLDPAPGGAGKVPIGPDYIEGEDQVRDPAGITHAVRKGGQACRWPAEGLQAAPSYSDDIETSHEAAGEPYPRRPGDRA